MAPTLNSLCRLSSMQMVVYSHSNHNTPLIGFIQITPPKTVGLGQLGNRNFQKKNKKSPMQNLNYDHVTLHVLLSYIVKYGLNCKF